MENSLQRSQCTRACHAWEQGRRETGGKQRASNQCKKSDCKTWRNLELISICLCIYLGYIPIAVSSKFSWRWHPMKTITTLTPHPATGHKQHENNMENSKAGKIKPWTNNLCKKMYFGLVPNKTEEIPGEPHEGTIPNVRCHHRKCLQLLPTSSLKEETQRTWLER